MVAKVRFEQVSKLYGEVAALTGVSLEIEEGEFLTLLGPSGSGKTTLLMILAGLVDPTSGRVWIDGADSTFVPSFRRDIGLVFQNYALFPHLSIYENIAFPLRMRRSGEDEIRQRVSEVLGAVRLQGVEERFPRELSGGQQQRIALARCIVYRPSIILMDEPLGALDKRLREQLQLEIKRLHRELGMTFLYVTHDQEEAMAMSDRICLMNNGSIEQLGPPTNLYFDPVSLFCGDFLGEANLFKGLVSQVEGNKVRVQTAGGQQLIASSKEPKIPGQEVMCLIRPESVHFAEAARSFENEVEARVEEVLVVGAMTRIYASLDDGTRLLSVHLTSRNGRSPSEGSRVRLGWSATDSALV